LIWILPLLACSGGGADTAADLLTELTSPGPYGVGFQVGELTYSDTVAGGERTLRLATWYPTGDSEGEEARYFLDSIEAPGVLADAAPLAGGLPLVVFSHGHTGYAENSAFLMEHLASHGYLVAAPDHTGNTILDGDDRQTEIYLQRPLDISATLDHLAGQWEITDTSAIGHSFGGYTLHALAGAGYDEALIGQCLDGSDTSSYCSTMTGALAERLRQGFSEPRVQAFISMAPGDYRLYGASLAEVDQRPILLMTGDLDERTGPDAEPIWEALRGGGNLHLRLAGGGHQTFTDYSGILETGDDLMDPEEGWRITDAYALAFLGYHRGDARMAEVLEGELAVSALAAFVE
jgi:predicted dienelactone hydrolase